MDFFRSHRRGWLIAAAAVLGSIALAAACVSGGLLGDAKYTAKVLLRGTLDPGKLNTGLPVITVNTRQGRPVTSKTEYLGADIKIRDPNNPENNFQGTVEIRGRGNTTWNAPKKPYRLKFDRKTSLFGYEKAKRYVLLANYQDTTLMLTLIAFELGRRFGLPFTPRYTPVEVVLNGRYEGSYALTEQVEVGRGRVELGAGGFLVELDSHYDEEPRFRTLRLELPVMIQHPQDLAVPGGYDFVQAALNGLEAALFAPSFPDSPWRELVDLQSWIDLIMINEITRNVDLQFPNSLYLYRRGEGEVIGAGPLWDFDYGFDYDARGAYFNDYRGMYAHTTFREGPGGELLSRLFEDPLFRAQYRDRWNERYPELTRMEAFIDGTAAALERTAAANAKVWWWNRVDYEAEIGRLKAWWRARIEYLHGEINQF